MSKISARYDVLNGAPRKDIQCRGAPSGPPGNYVVIASEAKQSVDSKVSRD